MLEGVEVNNETIADVALLKASVLQRENILLEAALNDAHSELARLRTLIPTDEEVKEDASRTNPAKAI